MNGDDDEEHPETMLGIVLWIMLIAAALFVLWWVL